MPSIFSMIIQLKLFSLQILASKSSNITPLANNHQESHGRSNLSVRFLRVSATHCEPFMYQDSDGAFFNGIEYKLLKTIADKEHLDLFFQNQHDSEPSHRHRWE